MTYDEYIAERSKGAFPELAFPREKWVPCPQCGVMPGDLHKCEIRGHYAFYSRIVEDYNARKERS